MKKTDVFIATMLLGSVLFTAEKCGNRSGHYLALAVDSCPAPSSWFPHSQTPSPEEGANSPFAKPKVTSNCDFHLWSWQKFLYLTRASGNGKLNFENLVQVDNQMNRLSGEVLILDDSSQAETNAVLLDKKNRAIYYAIYMDTMMFRFANKYVALFASNCGPRDSLEQSKMKKLGYDTLTYPVGSLEVKTSWILATSLSPIEVPEYYVAKGLMNNKITEVALIGMHIVGRVINHPEFIWATFDHKDLAPTVTWPQNILTDSIPDTAQILSRSNSVFYNANYPMDSCSITKLNKSKAPFKSTYHLFDHGTQPEYKGITKAARKQDSSNLANINMINGSVLSRLNTENGPWKNYAYFGSIWIDPTISTLQPGAAHIGSLRAPNLRGSRALSNVSMETYIQAFSPPTPIKSINCFGCHHTVNSKFKGRGADYNLALSHLFNNNLNTRLGLPKNPASKNAKYKLQLAE